VLQNFKDEFGIIVKTKDELTEEEKLNPSFKESNYDDVVYASYDLVTDSYEMHKLIKRCLGLMVTPKKISITYNRNYIFKRIHNTYINIKQ
jgi:hypothetical protein